MSSSSMVEQQNMLSEFARDMLSKHGITEPIAQEIAARYKQITAPYRFTIEPVQSTRSLSDIVKLPLSRVPTFILDAAELEKNLVLRPVPREDLQHSVVRFAAESSAVAATAPGPSVAPPAKKQRRSSAPSSSNSGAHGGTVSYTRATTVGESSSGTVGTQEAAYAYPSAAEALYSSSVRATVSVPSMAVDASVTSSVLPPSTALSNTAPISSPLQVDAEVDLTKAYPKMKEIFTFFWELELPDRFVNGAFFGRITELNFRDFGLERFFPDYTNLLFIKDKMDANLYFSYREFVHDFELMFQRICDCFPPAHEAVAEALKLQQRFQQMAAL